MASSFLKPQIEPPEGGVIEAESTGMKQSHAEINLGLVSSEQCQKNTPHDEYLLLQRQIYLATLSLSLLAVLLASLFLGMQFAISLLIGALSGILYLRLLARSISKLGKTSNSLSKFQLIVPVLLVLVAAKQPQIELLPALLGFLLYKPSLILQFAFESRNKI